MNANINRNSYGQIVGKSTQLTKARNLVEMAAKKKLIDAAYDTIRFDRKGRADGSAIHHEIFDFSRGKVLVCVRKTSGSKYGVVTDYKSYFLIESKNRKLVITNTDSASGKANPKIARLAKSDNIKFGDIIADLTGKKQVKVPVEVCVMYKQVALIDGKFYSIYDDSVEYVIGKPMIEAAREDHGGGFYVYPSIEAANKAVFPDSSDNLDEARVVLKCECSGKYVGYGNGKIAFTKVKPVAVVS